QRSASHSAGSPAQVSRSIREKQTLTPAEIASLPRGRWLVRAVGRRPILAASEPFWERDWDKKTKQLLSSKRSEEHTSELQSRFDIVCRLLLEKKKKTLFIILTTLINS